MKSSVLQERIFDVVWHQGPSVPRGSFGPVLGPAGWLIWPRVNLAPLVALRLFLVGDARKMFLMWVSRCWRHLLRLNRAFFCRSS